MKKVLLIGQNGQVSSYLQQAIDSRYELIVAGRDLIDLSEPSRVADALTQISPDIVVNPAAYTAVDLAEQESELAFLINRDSVGEIASFCSETQTPLIHFSTDYVFDGTSSTPYVESDTASPNGVYGASKFAGEQAVLETTAPAIILRTSWVYSNHGNNFYKTMLRLAQDRSELSVVVDQVGSPTYAGSIASVCADLIDQVLTIPSLATQHRGVFHFTCSGETSWCGFAETIFEMNGIEMTVNPIPTKAYPTPAKRPAYSVLSNEKLKRVFDVELPNWREALRACVDEADKLS